jgi:phospholipase/carboxylesterase
MTESLPNLEGPWAKPLSGGAPKQLIMFLHGVGADGNDLITLAHELAPHLPDAQFVSPNAPFECDMAPMGYQWFSLQNRDPDVLLQGARDVEPILNHYIDQQLKMYNIPAEKLGIVSFSQGTMTALHTMPRREQACGAIVCFSGALIGGDALQDEIKSKPPMCLIHGEMDDVVPFGAMALASEALLEAGVPHETHACPNVGHGIDPQGLLAAIEFLKSKLL